MGLNLINTLILMRRGLYYLFLYPIFIFIPEHRPISSNYYRISLTYNFNIFWRSIIFSFYERNCYYFCVVWTNYIINPKLFSTSNRSVCAKSIMCIHILYIYIFYHWILPKHIYTYFCIIFSSFSIKRKYIEKIVYILYTCILHKCISTCLYVCIYDIILVCTHRHSYSLFFLPELVITGSPVIIQTTVLV